MDKIIFDSEYMKVKDNNNYFYGERKGVDSVAFILIDMNKKEKPFGLVNERKPPFDNRQNENINGVTYKGDKAFITTAFGGSNDSIDMDKYFSMSESEKIEYFKEVVRKEVREESGYKVDTMDIVYIGKSMVSTQLNQFCYLFICEVTNKEQFEPEYDNEMEAESEVVWCSKNEIKENIDWKSNTILSKGDLA